MKQVNVLIKDLKKYYDLHGRDLPWRTVEIDGSYSAYKILVSEIMLQQTQVNRVIPKFENFVATYPTLNLLAHANLPDILKLWTGLGYNRRAKYLFDAARALNSIRQPWTIDNLTEQKGVGDNTAAAVMAYAYNQPVLFLETNIRTVLIHYFFMNKQQVKDRELLKLLEEVSKKAFDNFSPREFYWALMDYGTYLKSTVGNLNFKSTSYSKQTTFEGSKRQLRGVIIRLLTNGPLLQSELEHRFQDDRTKQVIKDLVREELLELRDNMLMLYNKS